MKTTTMKETLMAGKGAQYMDLVRSNAPSGRPQLHHRLKIGTVAILVDGIPSDDPDIMAVVNLILAAPKMLEACQRAHAKLARTSPPMLEPERRAFVMVLDEALTMAKTGRTLGEQIVHDGLKMQAEDDAAELAHHAVTGE